MLRGVRVEGLHPSRVLLEDSLDLLGLVLGNDVAEVESRTRRRGVTLTAAREVDLEVNLSFRKLRFDSSFEVQITRPM